MHLNTFGPLGVVHLTTFPQRGVNLLRRALLGLLLARGEAAVILATLLLHVTSQGVALHYLLGLVSRDHSVQTVKSSATHHIPDTLLFNPEPLNLIVDVKEEAVIARAVVARPHQEGPGPRPHQQVHSLVLAQVSVEPGKHGVRVNVLVQVRKQIFEHQPLLPGPVRRHPQPPVPEVVVDKEDVSLLEGDLVSVRHLGVGQNGNHPLLIIDGFWRWHRVHQPLVLEKITENAISPLLDSDKNRYNWLSYIGCLST